MKGLQPPEIAQHNMIAIGIKVSAILFATLTVFHQDLVILTNEGLQSELTTHILAIPFLFIYLIYRKRKMLGAVITFQTSNSSKTPTYIPELVGSLLCLTAVLLYWHGSYTFTPLEHHILSLPTFITGLTLNYTPWGIRLTPVTLSLLALTLTLATAALLREHQIKTKTL